MSKHASAQVYGTHSLGVVSVRPDGAVIKLSMLDPNDPGCDDSDAHEKRVARARDGSAALLAALRRLEALA